MTRTKGDPTLTGNIIDILRRLTSLERKVTTPRPAVEQPFPMGVDGALSVVTTPPQPFTRGGKLVGALGALGTAGSSTTTAVLKKNGSTVLTITFAASATRSKVNITPGVVFHANYDLMTLAVTTAGTSAADLTVLPIFEE